MQLPKSHTVGNAGIEECVHQHRQIVGARSRLDMPGAVPMVSDKATGVQLHSL